MTDTTNTNITPEDQELFNALVSGNYNNFALFSCFCNGKPAVAIVCITEDDSDSETPIHIHPQWVKYDPEVMTLTDHEGTEA